MANDLRRNVVRIESKFLNGRTENGFGFIVGERSGRLYVVTAYHVVVDKDDVGSNAQANVKMEFFGLAGQMSDAVLLGTHDANRDLAVLTVAAPQGFAWTKQSLAGPEKQKRGTPIWFIGRDRKWNPPVSPGHVLTEPSTEWLLELEGLAVRPGSSGGPVISSTGIIGMIQRDSEQGTQALSIDFIQKIMLEWNHPWQLENTATSDKPDISSPPDSYSPQADMEAIQMLVESYRDSYNRIDAKSLWIVWPNAPAKTKRDIEDSFKSALSIKLEFKLDPPEIAADRVNATVKGKQVIEFTGKSGGPRKSTDTIVFHFKKTGGTWKLDTRE